MRLPQDIQGAFTAPPARLLLTFLAINVEVRLATDQLLKSPWMWLNWIPKMPISKPTINPKSHVAERKHPGGELHKHLAWPSCECSWWVFINISRIKSLLGTELLWITAVQSSFVQSMRKDPSLPPQVLQWRGCRLNYLLEKWNQWVISHQLKRFSEQTLS